MSSCLLIINSAEGLLQLVLAGRKGEAAPWSPLLYDSVPAASQGAELLAPRLRLCLGRLDLAPTALSHIAVVRGPGSFTGLRLALSTAAGLARAVGARQTGLDYLPLLAASALPGLGPPVPDSLWVLTHARRNLLHVQGFAIRAGERPEALGPLLVASPDAAFKLAAARAEAGGAALLGSGLDKNRDFFAKAAGALRASGGPLLELLGPESSPPRPQALLEAASNAIFGAEDVSPLYARPCDAEENLEQIAACLGLDPAAARRRLDELTGK